MFPLRNILRLRLLLITPTMLFTTRLAVFIIMSILKLDKIKSNQIKIEIQAYLQVYTQIRQNTFIESCCLFFVNQVVVAVRNLLRV